MKCAGHRGWAWAWSAHTYTWVLEQGTEDSPADSVRVLYTEGGEGHPEKSGGRGRQGADLVTREGAESRLPFLFPSHTLQMAVHVVEEKPGLCLSRVTLAPKPQGPIWGPGAKKFHA